MSSKRLIALLAALGVAGFAFGYLGTWPPVATVMSGSMSPTIKTGDVVVLKKLHGMPHVGDIIAVTVPDEARARYGYPPVVTHRVVRIAPDGSITTKGDARKTPDPFTVHRSAVSAKVLLHIPAAGRVMAFLMSPMGLLWIAGGAVLLFVMPSLERRHEAEAAEQETLAALRAELHAITEQLAQLQPPQPAPVEEEPEPEPEPEPDAEILPAVDWTELETMPEPEPRPEPEVVPEPVTYVVRRRSGGLLGRLR